MKIKEKINLDYKGLVEHGPITIVAFGDSVTHGAFEIGVLDYENVYWNQLRKKINAKRNYVPVNVINAGIGGITASLSLSRLEKQVLAHNPDLVIVCFGLNDVNSTLEAYLGALRVIFTKVLESGSDLIFMTPNMMNTYVAKHTAPDNLTYAHKTAQMQTEGRLDLFIEKAIELAKELGVTVCDCYAKWKEMSKTQDIVPLLANGINHPTREMHGLFADCLMETIFDETINVQQTESTMYK